MFPSAGFQCKTRFTISLWLSRVLYPLVDTPTSRRFQVPLSIPDHLHRRSAGFYARTSTNSPAAQMSPISLPHPSLLAPNHPTPQKITDMPFPTSLHRRRITKSTMYRGGVIDLAASLTVSSSITDD